MLPLVDEPSADARPGWVSYESTLSESPEIEFLCGGINTKTPAAVGLWRQGNLLHFGFEETPAQLNDTGDALLVNAIHYIAKFTEDRPILQAASPFAGTSTRARSAYESWLKNESFPLNFFVESIDADVIPAEVEQTREKLLAWYQSARGYLRPNEDGKLTIDREIRLLGLSYDDPSFFQGAIEALDDTTRSDAARTALARYAPGGPDRDAALREWRAWVEDNRPYLYFSEYGGYRWYIDPLAKKRGVPTQDLFGPMRADRSTRTTRGS